MFLTSRFGLISSTLNSWQSSNLPAYNMRTNCSQSVGFHFPMCLQRCSPADARLECMAIPQRSCTQMGRRRWPPLGEFNGIISTASYIFQMFSGAAAAATAAAPPSKEAPCDPHLKIRQSFFAFLTVSKFPRFLDVL